MGKFNVCYKVATGTEASYAWIALHRCVEANARLTGETFRSIFSRLEETHGFSRENLSQWPDLSQIHAAAEQLRGERNAWLQEWNELIAQRRIEKQSGQRQLSHGRLKELSLKQQSHSVPFMGCWGWRKLR